MKNHHSTTQMQTQTQTKTTTTIPLSMVASGQHLRVIGIAAGRRAKRRLADLGLIPNTELDIVQNQGSGPLILAVGDTRIAIERGIAHKVLVQPFMQQQVQEHVHSTAQEVSPWSV